MLLLELKLLFVALVLFIAMECNSWTIGGFFACNRPMTSIYSSQPWNKGKQIPDDLREKIRQGMKEFNRSKREKKAQSLGISLEEYEKSLQKTVRPRVISPEGRQSLSEFRKKMWKDPIYRQNMTQVMKNVQSSRPRSNNTRSSRLSTKNSTYFKNVSNNNSSTTINISSACIEGDSKAARCYKTKEMNVAEKEEIERKKNLKMEQKLEKERLREEQNAKKAMEMEIKMQEKLEKQRIKAEKILQAKQKSPRKSVVKANLTSCDKEVENELDFKMDEDNVRSNGKMAEKSKTAIMGRPRKQPQQVASQSQLSQKNTVQQPQPQQQSSQPQRQQQLQKESKSQEQSLIEEDEEDEEDEIDEDAFYYEVTENGKATLMSEMEYSNWLKSHPQHKYRAFY